MPIGGGNFTLMNKVIPGAYINTIAGATTVTAGSRGIAALPVVLSWGAEKQLIAMDAGDFSKNALKVFGYSATAPELLLIREALKRAKTLLFYRVNGGGAKATATAGGVTATAKYSGKRGNDIKVAVLANPDGGFDVVSYLDGREVDKQTVTVATELVDNAFIDFSGSGSLSAVAAASLTGGEDGAATGEDYSDFLAAVEVEEFNAVGYCGDDATTKALFNTFIKRVRDDEGKKAVCVLSNYANADYEGVISVKNGVVLDDGTELTPEQAVAWVAGASAGAEINESLTNTVYDGAVGVTEKYTKSQYEAAIKAGEFVFYADNGKARVLRDINTLVTYGGGKSSDFASNRLMRTLDGWANDVAALFGNSYLGLQSNDETGRDLFKGDLVKLAQQYQSIRAITNFKVEDITISQGDGKADVAVNAALQPVDSMEKLYMTVTVV